MKCVNNDVTGKFKNRTLFIVVHRNIVLTLDFSTVVFFDEFCFTTAVFRLLNELFLKMHRCFLRTVCYDRCSINVTTVLLRL